MELNKTVEFVVESKGLCFLCMGKTSAIEQEPGGVLPPIQIHLLQYLTHYLKMDVLKLFNDEDEGHSTAELLANVGKSRLKVTLCEDCSSLNDQFSELYRQLEILEMKVGSCLRLIEQKLVSINGSSEKTANARKVMKLLEVLRTDAVEKCSKKLKTLQPRVKVDKLMTEAISVEKSKIITDVSSSQGEREIAWSATLTEATEVILKQNVIKIESETPTSDFTLDDDFHPDDSNSSGEALSDGVGPTKLSTGDQPNTGTGLLTTSPDIESVVSPKSKMKMELLTPKPRINPKNGKYKCGHCSREFGTRVGYRQHFEGTHKGVKFTCQVCKKSFARKAVLRRHQQTTPCRKKLGSGTSTVPELITYTKLVEGAPCESNDNAETQVTAVDSSDVSTKRKKYFKGWKKRYSVNPSSGKYECRLCPKEFRTDSGMHTHWKAVHDGDKFSCNVCQEQFTQIGSLKRHQYTSDCGKKLGMETRTAPEEICTICEKVIFSDFTLKQHMDGVHLKLGKYACALCDKKYNINSQLAIHMKAVHLKTYVCQHCGKKFTGKQSLQAHLKNGIHEKLKKHGCNFCEEEFYTRVALRKHHRKLQEDGVHLKLKPYGCDLCEKKYTTGSELGRHRRTVHLGKKNVYVCEHCGKKFGQQGNLQTHLDGFHRKLMNYGCDVCEKKFNTKAPLGMHRRIVHLGVEEKKNEGPMGKSYNLKVVR